MRWIAALLISVLSAQVLAEGRHAVDVSYQRRQDCSIVTEQNKLNPFAYLFREQCEQIIANTRQNQARILGKPQPSKTVLTVPAHGSGEAKRLGVACMGGLVLLRLENGWEQALDRDHRYYTCSDK